MAKVGSNKEAGVEKAPVITEDKGVEITPEMVAELQAKNAELEDNNVLMGNEIETQKETIAVQGDTLKEQAEKIGKLQSDCTSLEAYNTELKDEIELKESIIKDKDNVIKDLDGKIAWFITDTSNLGVNAQEAGKALANALSIAGGDTVLIRFLLSPAGRFKLPYNVGQEVALHKEVAAEIVEAMYAEYVE